MAKEKKYVQSKIYEFSPSDNITIEEIIELASLIRIGVSGEILEKASDRLKKQFQEVKNSG